MTDLVVALSLAVAVTAVALVVRRRRRSDVPTQRSYSVPTQIDPHDFVGNIGDGLESVVVVFTSSTCHVCADVWDKAQVLESRQVAVRRADYETERDLHRRYGIDAVPTVVICDDHGVVLQHFLGPVSATDLWAAVARLRDPSADSDDESGDCTRH